MFRPDNNLGSLISKLEQEGDLVRITAPVDPILEIAAITDRVCKETGGGRALLFENPVGSDFPLVTNLFGSERRVCRALGVEKLHLLTDRMTHLLTQIPEPELDVLDQQIAALPGFAAFSPMQIKTDTTGIYSEVNPPDLTTLPFLQRWPGDGSATGHSRYITLGQTHTIDPQNNSRNSGLYRAQILGAQELAIQCKPGSGAARHAEVYEKLGAAMPVAIVLGGDPATLFSAMFPLPGELDELNFAGFLRGIPLELEQCRTVPLWVPTGAELVIEGWCKPGETVVEGPFGNHTGSYAPAAPARLMQVTAIRHRPGAVIPATVVGPPLMEDCWMAKAWERLLCAFLRRLIPAVAEIHFPLEWVFHQSAIISLEKPTPAMVREIAGQLWNTRWFGAARLLIFMDATVRPDAVASVAWRAINLPDHKKAIFYDQTNTHMAIDLCAERPEPTVMPINITDRVAQRWHELGLA